MRSSKKGTLSAPVLRQTVEFGARYVSSELNRKLAGVLERGIYHGFLVKPGGVARVLITKDSLYRNSVAVVDRNGYSITVTMQGDGYVTIPAAGKWYIVVEAFYAEGEKGYQRVVAREKVECHHVVLAYVKVEDITKPITESMIDLTKRTYGQRELQKFLAVLNTLLHPKRFKTVLTENNPNGFVLDMADIGINSEEDYCYIPGLNAVLVSWNGITCHLGSNYTECAADEDGFSRKLNILFPTEINDEIEVLILSHTNPPYWLDTSMAYADPVSVGDTGDEITSGELMLVDDVNLVPAFEEGLEQGDPEAEPVGGEEDTTPASEINPDDIDFIDDFEQGLNTITGTNDTSLNEDEIDFIDKFEQGLNG